MQNHAICIFPILARERRDILRSTVYKHHSLLLARCVCGALCPWDAQVHRFSPVRATTTTITATCTAGSLGRRRKRAALLLGSPSARAATAADSAPTPAAAPASSLLLQHALLLLLQQLLLLLQRRDVFLQALQAATRGSMRHRITQHSDDGRLPYPDSSVRPHNGLLDGGNGGNQLEVGRRRPC